MTSSTLILLAAIITTGFTSSLLAQDDSPNPSVNVPVPQNQASPQLPQTGRAPGSFQKPITKPNQAPASPAFPSPAPAPAAEAPMAAPIIQEVQPSAPAIPVNDSLKSQDQRTFESNIQTRVDALAKEIDDLNARPKLSQASRQRIFEEMMQTAAGNRSVARTKLKQLKLIPPAQWLTLKTGIEKALLNLEDSVASAKAYAEVP